MSDEQSSPLHTNSNSRKLSPLIAVGGLGGLQNSPRRPISDPTLSPVTTGDGIQNSPRRPLSDHPNAGHIIYHISYVVINISHIIFSYAIYIS